MMIAYLILTTVLFLWLGVIWSRKTWGNLTFKFGFISLAIAGGLLSLQALGYIVKGVA